MHFVCDTPLPYANEKRIRKVNRIFSTNTETRKRLKPFDNLAAITTTTIKKRQRKSFFLPFVCCHFLSSHFWFRKKIEFVD